MLMTERHILKSIRRVAGELPDATTDRDTRFVIKATNAALSNLIDAEEPINQTHRYHERAKHIASTLEAFLKHRHQEEWSADSTFPYHASLMQEVTENRDKEA